MARVLARCLAVTWWTQLGVFALTVASLGVDDLAGTRCVPVVAENCTIGAWDEDGRWYLLTAAVLQGVLVVVPCLVVCAWRTRASSSSSACAALSLRRRSGGDDADDVVARKWHNSEFDVIDSTYLYELEYGTRLNQVAPAVSTTTATATTALTTQRSPPPPQRQRQRPGERDEEEQVTVI